MRTTAALCAALGLCLLWGFDMSAALNGWMALRLAAGILVICAAFGCWVRHREIQKGLHQWPTPKGRFYNEWMTLPIDHTPADYYAWLAESKDWSEPWATWAKWAGGTSEPPSEAGQTTKRKIRNLKSTTPTEQEQREKSARFLKRLEQARALARERQQK
jgi:hypothetical protein